MERNVIRHPEDLPTGAGQASVAVFIRSRHMRQAVHPAINFDDKRNFRNGEIYNHPAHRMLTPYRVSIVSECT